jgi:hypothetical protein
VSSRTTIIRSPAWCGATAGERTAIAFSDVEPISNVQFSNTGLTAGAVVDAVVVGFCAANPTLAASATLANNAVMDVKRDRIVMSRPPDGELGGLYGPSTAHHISQIRFM